MRRTIVFLLCLLLVLASGPLWAEQSIQIRVSATILPHPCEYPNRCDPVPATTQTKAVVDNGVVSYVGSPPEVTEKDGLMTVKF